MGVTFAGDGASDADAGEDDTGKGEGADGFAEAGDPSAASTGETVSKAIRAGDGVALTMRYGSAFVIRILASSCAGVNLLP